MYGSKSISAASKRSLPSWVSVSYLHEVAVGEHVVLLEEDCLVGEFAVESDVRADEAELFFDLFDGLEVCGGVEGVSPEEEQLGEVLGDFLSRELGLFDPVVDDVAVDDWDDVGDAIAGVEDAGGHPAL